MDWFLYDNGLRHERVNGLLSVWQSDEIIEYFLQIIEVKL